MIEPEQCRTMSEVRAGVDAIDDEIVRLLGRRFRLMEAAARIKQDREAVRDEQRKAAVIERVRRAADQAGSPSGLVADLYEQLIEGSIAYEFHIFDALRDR
jgi:isochorismate pyruvate lyase